MKIALIQLNPVIGDFEANVERMLERLALAREKGCGLAVFPELSLCGYPPRDLLERPAFLDSHDRALHWFIDRVTGIACVAGVLERRTGSGNPLYNSAFFIRDGRVAHRARKQLLPTYDVFDERRYFEPGQPGMPFMFAGRKIALSVCEDIWYPHGRYEYDPVACLCRDGSRPEILINISASPYHHGKITQRQKLFRSLCRQGDFSLVYVNQCGAQDELIFDGHSLVMDAAGTVLGAASGFCEDLLVVDLNENGMKTDGRIPEDSLEMVLDALTLGVRDYLAKTGFTRAVIGLSGGIDSALTAVIAVRALGGENVLCVALPSPYTAPMSVEDARLLAANLGCGFQVIPIEGVMEGMNRALRPLFAGMEEDVTEQNLQARIRGTLLMALSNKFGHLLLSTGNKSEMAVGYCTLYGDMNGGLAVLADVPKTMVYALARLVNQQRPVIPERIISRPPSAELKPDQKDQDDLPPYDVLDRILAGYLEEMCSVDELVEQGFARDTVLDIVARIKRNEYKRKQAPLGLKVTSKAFGYGRRYPVAQRFIES